MHSVIERSIGRNMTYPEKEWPEHGLQSLAHCPVCSSAARKPVFNGLTDNCFFVAPGKWNLWQCEQCGTGYLDPRPDEATIGLAYANYYTHDEDTDVAAPSTAFARFRKRLGNGYRNFRFGAHLVPASSLGAFIGAVTPQTKMAIDATYRYLPRRHSPGAVVLDIGCGNGAWLELAQSIGWSAVGVEPDPVARARACERGFDVRQSIDEWRNAAPAADVITMNHVIEHVHEPLELLRSCFELLRERGKLFLETPNFGALGLSIYGRNWRGLEPPRHLTLFNRHSLESSLRKSGFSKVRFHRRPGLLSGLGILSSRSAAGIAQDCTEMDASFDGPGLLMRMHSFLSIDKGEILTVTCERDR